MSNFRYHVHIIQVVGEQPIAHSQLALFFENRAFLTYDLPTILPETVAYSRRCIEKCDCVVLVVGNQYGETNASGVSQQHLSYLTAKTKNKPLLIFVKKTTANSSRQVVDFIKLLELQNNKFLHYYQHEPVLRQHLDNVYDEFERSFVPKQWRRMNNDVLLPQKGLPASATVQYNSNQGTNDYGTSNLQRIASDTVSSKKADISDIGVNSDSIGDAYDVFLNEHISTQQSCQTTRPKKNQQAAKLTHNQLTTSAHASMSIENTEVTLFDDLVINYRAHAYQEGNLSDISLSLKTQWLQIIQTLSKLGSQFTTESIYRGLNDLVAQSANLTIKQTMPNVHAVSRCQVSQIDFVWIHSQLRYNGWLETSIANAINVTSRHSPKVDYWQLTEAAIDELCLLGDID